jgi:YcxB-like protein
MTVKTRKYQLPAKTYINLGMANILKTQWWLPVAIFFGIIVLNLLLNLVYRNYWIYILAPVATGGYFLFWYIQFYGATQLERSKILFEKFSYEIDSRFILMKVNQKEGMQINWDMIKSAVKRKDDFILTISKAQFIQLPFKIFNSDNDVRFTEALLKKKGLIKS